MERWTVAESDFVFPNRNGELLRPTSVKAWRQARGDELAHVTLRAFRRTVATLVADEYGPDEAARQLGHEDSQITRERYIQRAEAAGDFTSVLNRLSPGN